MCVCIVERREIHATMRRCTKYDFFLFSEHFKCRRTQSERKKWNHNSDCRRLVSTATHSYTLRAGENGSKQDKKQSTFWQIYYIWPVLSLNYITESRNRRNVLFCVCAVLCFSFLLYCILFHCSDRAHIFLYILIYISFWFVFMFIHSHISLFRWLWLCENEINAF